MKARTCEQCGTKLPFGVKRRTVDGRKLCGGCANGREGRPLTHGGKLAYRTVQEEERGYIETRFYDDEDFLVARAWSEGNISGWVTYDDVGAEILSGPAPSYEDALFRAEDEAGSVSRTAKTHTAAPPPGGGPPKPPAFLQDPKKKDAGSDIDAAFEEEAGGAADGDLDAALEEEMPGAPPPGPGGPPGGATPGGGLGTFAPDRTSDKVVRVCPFCGSGQIIGQSDGSIECGHESISFLVEVLPRHPFQPLVDEEGQPFEMTTEEDDPAPEIGVARAADAPTPPQPGDGAVDKPEGPPKDDGGGDKPDFLKGGMFITEAGFALPEDEYVEHLAQTLPG